MQVKWVGYPDPTPEPLYQILQQTNHPDVLANIERCKADHLLLKSGGAVNLVQSLVGHYRPSPERPRRMLAVAPRCWSNCAPSRGMT